MAARTRTRDTLSHFELMLMLAVIRAGEDAYGVLVAREMEAATGKEVLLGSVYASLERLETRGLVTSRLGDPSPERGGRAKRYVRVTAAGRRVVREARRGLVALWNNLPELAS